MYNRTTLIGRLCASPELKQTQNGVPVASFRIACDRRYNREETDFINIVAWREKAEFVCKYFQKGSAIGVEGSIQTREYTDREGNRRTAFEVVGDQFFFVESKKARNPADVEYEKIEFQEVEGGDDLPF